MSTSPDESNQEEALFEGILIQYIDACVFLRLLRKSAPHRAPSIESHIQELPTDRGQGSTKDQLNWQMDSPFWENRVLGHASNPQPLIHLQRLLTFPRNKLGATNKRPNRTGPNKTKAITWAPSKWCSFCFQLATFREPTEGRRKTNARVASRKAQQKTGSLFPGSDPFPKQPTAPALQNLQLAGRKAGWQQGSS